ncbi:MAG: TolC family protein [Planctomyces sp.]|nr:TolC family protein [Planctomyces sp.]
MLVIASACSPVTAQLHVDEEHRIRWHEEGELSRFQRGIGPAPVTVASEEAKGVERFLPLDEAISIALQHSEVIRVLTGVSASSSGQTIYDTAIATTPIDQAVARFDPVFSANSSFRHTETPFSTTDPGDPLGALITDRGVGGTDASAGFSKTNRFGGIADARAVDRWNNSLHGPPGSGTLDPAHNIAMELSYTQPLLAGFGRSANEAPIVIARLQQDQSYFQFKNGMQELVRGVINAYWSLVQARTELWAREKQVDATREAYEYQAARLRTGRGKKSDEAQAASAYADAKASVVSAQASVLQREAALRNLIGLPPEDGNRLVPSTPPTRDQLEFRWNELVETAQQLRPDLIELNLILMADTQRLIQRNNSAQPNFDAVALHRWNGLSGTMQNGSNLSSSMDDHTDWTLGVTFSVPMGLRQARAQLRTQELLIAKDRANIQQSLHQIEHSMATSIRNIDQQYALYLAFKEARAAARENLLAQISDARQGRAILLNVLQAISSLGNSTAAEAQALTLYNIELANLEFQTGTILETHGIRFVEEQYTSMSAWGRHFEDDCYPRSLSPQKDGVRYEDSNEEAEKVFNLEDFPTRRSGEEPEKPELPKAPDIDPLTPYEQEQSAKEKKGRMFRWISLERVFRN